MANPLNPRNSRGTAASSAAWHLAHPAPFEVDAMADPPFHVMVAAFWFALGVRHCFAVEKREGRTASGVQDGLIVS